MTLLSNFFTNEPFDMMSLTESLDKLPITENLIGEMGLYVGMGIETDIVEIDETDGVLQILQTRPRGSEPQRATPETKRKARLLKVPHFEFEERITASQLQGVRATGEINLQNAVTKVNERLTWMKQQYEHTREVHRLGGLRGILLDADNTTIFDYFSEFEVTQDTVNFDFGTASTEVRNVAIQTVRNIEDNLGGVPHRGAAALVGRDFFDALVGHPEVKETFKRQSEATNRADLRKGFLFGDVMWTEYRGFRGLVPDVGTIDDVEGFMFPMGVPGMFREVWAPGDFLETVNQIGQSMIAKTAPDLKYNKFVDVLIEANPLHLNTRPNAVIKLTKT